MQNENISEPLSVNETVPAERTSLLNIEVVELSDLEDDTADVVFFRSTCTTCSTS